MFWRTAKRHSEIQQIDNLRYEVSFRRIQRRETEERRNGSGQNKK